LIKIIKHQKIALSIFNKDVSLSARTLTVQLKWTEKIIMKNSDEIIKEWLRQADYDFDTAKAMFKTGRYIYCIFMCHLSLEKALKGILIKHKNEIPPKSHNLIYLVEKIELKLNEEDYKFIFKLNDVSIPTRYPEDLKKIMKVYKKEITREFLTKTNKLLKWIKEQ